MTWLSADDPLARALHELMPQDAAWPPSGKVILEPLPSSRPVFRLSSPEGGSPAVGKFFFAYPPTSPADQGLAQEYDNYLKVAAWQGRDEPGPIPRLLGRRPHSRLGLLLAAIPGPDLDILLKSACLCGAEAPLRQGLESLAGLLAFIHTRPLPPASVSPEPALGYLDKLRGQLKTLGVLSPEDDESLEAEKCAWEGRLLQLPDRQVVVHGDATSTNFLFPNGQAVALDLERLGSGDRLWDLSWLAGEIKHGFGWRTGAMEPAESFISHFFSAYLAAVEVGPDLATRVFRLNPFYMALAELRIARNGYLTCDYRRGLVQEARRCLYFGRRV